MRKLKRRKKETVRELREQKDEKKDRIVLVKSRNSQKKKSDKEKLPIIVKRKIKKKYKKQRCSFVGMTSRESTEISQCKNLAVGKGTLCKKHGGDPVIKENLISTTMAKYLDFPNAKFEASVHPIQYIQMSREGSSEVEIAAQFEVSVDTLRKWAEKYESFNTAYEVGQAMHEAWWIREGKSNLNERSFNTSLFKFLTMNKVGYSDKIEQKSMNMNVHGVLVIPDKVTAEEWEEEVVDV